MAYTHKNSVTLKKLDIECLSLLYELKQESWFGTHRNSWLNWSDQKEWFDRIAKSGNDYIMIAWSGLEPVGVYKATNIDWVNRFYDSAHDVFKNHRNKGLGSKVLEAGVDFGFEMLNMNRLNSEVIANNEASMKNALKVGFALEGTRKKAILKCGQWLDSHIIGITHDHWQTLERVKAYGGCCNFDYTPTGKV